MKENQNINFENIRSEIESRINAAKLNAINVNGLSAIDAYNKMIKSGSVMEFANIVEFKLALEILDISKDLVEQVLSHENAHANKSESLEGELYAYQISIAKDGVKYVYTPSVKLLYPAAWGEEKINATKKAVLMAPAEYGNKLSEADMEDLAKH